MSISEEGAQRLRDAFEGCSMRVFAYALRHTDRGAAPDAMLLALAELSEAERESLLLIAWDGLSVTDAAAVAGCTRNAFEVRLHRARARLRRMQPDDPEPARVAAPRPHLALEHRR